MDRPSVLSSATTHCGPSKPSPLPFPQPLEGFLLKMGRWRSAAATALDLLSSRGSACLQRAHSTARGNSRIAGWTRSVVCSFVSESLRLDSAALVMVGRSQHVCVGRCRPFGREGSARNAGAPGGLARTMVRASDHHDTVSPVTTLLPMFPDSRTLLRQYCHPASHGP